MSYSENYKNPKWQKKRLEVLNRDEFTCQSCHSTEKTLNIHHCVPYRKGAMPYDYKNDELVTFCEDCHKEISEKIRYCMAIIMDRCWCTSSADEISKVIGTLNGIMPNELVQLYKLIKKHLNGTG